MRPERLVIPISILLLMLPPTALAQQCEMPNMMILLDRSGSMHWNGCTSNTKWADATGAIDFIVSNYDHALRFGLDMFPSDDGCGVGVVYVDVGINTYSAIMSGLASHPPYGSCIGMTPLAVSLAALNQYRQLKDPDRRNFIMLISDGSDTCAGSPNSDPVQAASDLLAGGVRTFVIGFGSGANPTVLNNVASAGGTGSYYQAGSQSQLQQAMDQIIAEALVEICDDRDNNCNDQVDEDWPAKGDLCTEQVGGCVAMGQLVCNAAGNGLVCNAQVQPSQEVCDGVDNDCDGVIDNGFPDLDGDGWTNCSDCCDSGTEAMQGCTGATRASINPGATERCNGYDDDCDGAIDESDPQLGQQCGSTDEGVCEYGSRLCSGGNLICIGEVAPGDEINCDDLDNDCDGLTDEDEGPEICDDGIDNDCDGLVDGWDDDCGSACVPGQQRPCGNDAGDCIAGIQTCDENGLWGPCEGGYAGSEEVCDGRDNDCDGDVDEDDVCGSGDECEPGEQRECGSDVGECISGVQICSSEGYWIDCAGGRGPVPEWCNALDDDCDGLTDEGDLCDIYEVCLCGDCAAPCSAGECSGNFTCVYDWCVTDPCCGINCPPGEECDDSGRCVDVCETGGIQCPEGQDCRMGICVNADCYTPGNECAEGQRCVEGVCQSDPCFGVDCPDGQYCRAGGCEDLVCAACGAGQVCVEGVCTDSLCADMICAEGQICVDGQCAADPCQGVYCPDGSVCIDGDCSADPCEAVDCPDESHCQDGYCVPDEPAQPDGGVDAGPDGGEDAGADAGADTGADTGADPGADQGGQDAGDAAGDTGDQGGGDGCGCLTGGSTRSQGGWLLLLLVLGLAALRIRSP